MLNINNNLLLYLGFDKKNYGVRIQEQLLDPLYHACTHSFLVCVLRSTPYHALINIWATLSYE